MKKICVIGNSHTAAIIAAWNELSDNYPTTTLTFFAHPANGLFNLELKSESLTPTSYLLENSFPINSGGKTKIDILEYDSFLLYGLLDPNDYLYKENEVLSAAVFKSLCQDIEDNNLTFFILNMLRKVTDANIYLGLAPYKAHRGQVEDNILITSEDSPNLALEFLAKKFDVDFLFQPNETIVEGKFTLEDFRREHPNLNVGNESAFKQKMPDDLKHMNKEYGILWLKSMLNKITISG